jgi:hypothetical protein
MVTLTSQLTGRAILEQNGSTEALVHCGQVATGFVLHSDMDRRRAEFGTQREQLSGAATPP